MERASGAASTTAAQAARNNFGDLLRNAAPRQFSTSRPKERGCNWSWQAAEIIAGAQIAAGNNT